MNNCLKEKRLEKGYSQLELAEIAKVSRATIIRIEQGNLKYLKSDTMLKLALALDSDISDIFFKDFVMQTQQNGDISSCYEVEEGR